jgi:thiamine-phosphate diphosphorylase
MSMAVSRLLEGYYAILDVKGTSADISSLVRHADRLLAAGPCCLQLRGKDLPIATVCELGHALRARCDQSGIPLCLNDRLDVALAVNADIIHLGQGDLPLGEVVRLRARWGLANVRVGISASDLRQATEAEAAGADYIGFGPVFPTQTKLDASPASGLETLRQVALALRVPVVAIGGITLDNVDSVAQAGAAAAAAIAAVDQAPDPTAAGRRIAAAFAGRR